MVTKLLRGTNNVCGLVHFHDIVITSVSLGRAEEFKVAAINKNGSGEFSFITPCSVVYGMLKSRMLPLLPVMR